MNRTGTQAASRNFSLRSIFALVVLAALFGFSLDQYRRNRQLRHRLDYLTSQLDHMKATDEVMAANFRQLVALVENKPAFDVNESSK